MHRGVRQADILMQIGADGADLDSFRTALYRARKRAATRRKNTGAATGTGAPASLVSAQSTAAAAPRQQSTAKHAPEDLPISKARRISSNPREAVRGPSIETPRDFLELVRSTKDSEIF